MLQVVVIIGAGRSGTKFLRDVLAGADEVRAVPYDVNYIWRQGFESIATHDEIPAEHYTAEQAQRIQRDLARQAGADWRNGKRCILLEKTVSNCLRVPYVARVLPGAKFIHLVRDGREVVESAFRNWTASPDVGYLWRKARTYPIRNWRYAVRYGINLLRGQNAAAGRKRTIWGPRYAGIDEDLAVMPLEAVVARQWVRCVISAFDGLRGLPDAQVLEVRYESLIGSEQTIQRIAEFLALEDTSGALRSYRDKLAPPQGSGWLRTFDDRQRTIVLAEIKGLLGRLGYGEEISVEGS